MSISTTPAVDVRCQCCGGTIVGKSAVVGQNGPYHEECFRGLQIDIANLREQLLRAFCLEDHRSYQMKVMEMNITQARNELGELRKKIDAANAALDEVWKWFPTITLSPEALLRFNREVLPLIEKARKQP